MQNIFDSRKENYLMLLPWMLCYFSQTMQQLRYLFAQKWHTISESIKLSPTDVSVFQYYQLHFSRILN